LSLQSVRVCDNRIEIGVHQRPRHSLRRKGGMSCLLGDGNQLECYVTS